MPNFFPVRSNPTPVAAKARMQRLHLFLATLSNHLPFIQQQDIDTYLAEEFLPGKSPQLTVSPLLTDDVSDAEIIALQKRVLLDYCKNTPLGQGLSPEQKKIIESITSHGRGVDSWTDFYQALFLTGLLFRDGILMKLSGYHCGHISFATIPGASWRSVLAFSCSNIPDSATLIHYCGGQDVNTRKFYPLAELEFFIKLMFSKEAGLSTGEIRVLLEPITLVEVYGLQVEQLMRVFASLPVLWQKVDMMRLWLGYFKEHPSPVNTGQLPQDLSRRQTYFLSALKDISWNRSPLAIDLQRVALQTLLHALVSEGVDSREERISWQEFYRKMAAPFEAVLQRFTEDKLFVGKFFDFVNGLQVTSEHKRIFLRWITWQCMRHLSPSAVQKRIKNKPTIFRGLLLCDAGDDAGNIEWMTHCIEQLLVYKQSKNNDELWCGFIREFFYPEAYCGVENMKRVLQRISPDSLAQLFPDRILVQQELTQTLSLLIDQKPCQEKILSPLEGLATCFPPHCSRAINRAPEIGKRRDSQTPGKSQPPRVVSRQKARPISSSPASTSELLPVGVSRRVIRAPSSSLGTVFGEALPPAHGTPPPFDDSRLKLLADVASNASPVPDA